MLGGLPEWLAEINNSPDHKIVFENDRTNFIPVDNSAVTDGTERIDYYASVENVSPYPRMTVVNARWFFDFHGGNCMSEVSETLTIELLKPTTTHNIISKEDYLNATPEQRKYFTQMFIEVCGSIQTIFEAFSELSYGGGVPFAQANIETTFGPWWKPHEELPVLSLADEPLHVWWCEFNIRPKTY